MPPLETYGLEWSSAPRQIDIELQMIRQGGYFTARGVTYGKGLFHHYRAAMSQCWPEDDHHRWSDLVLKTYLEERLTVITGSRDAGKTRTISKIVLLDYWVWPQDTLILMTSTTVQGLELRVWGDIKSLYRRARERFPDLAGNVVDAKHGLFTDDISETEDVRVMNKGIIGIPLISSQNEFQGSNLKNFAGIKQRRRRLVGDECFPAGTMVDTWRGRVPIEDIKVGDRVWSAVGWNQVVAASVRWAKELVTVHTKDGRKVRCTPDHEFLTHKGWVKACNLSEEHFIVGAYESLQALREPNSKQAHLFKEMLVRVDAQRRSAEASLHSTTPEEREDQSCSTDEHRESYEEGGVSSEGQSHSEGDGIQTHSQRREWDRTNKGRVATAENVSRGRMELSSANQDETGKRIPDLLQVGSGNSQTETGNRSRWIITYELGQSEVQRREERPFPHGSWVDRVEVQKQSDFGLSDASLDSSGCAVYNLQAAIHPSYSVEGLIVHNCQFIHVDYLTVLDSLDKGDFKGVIVGNPIANNGKALDRVSEPKDGWGSQGEITKTTTWRNKYNGVTINLVGIDSPNFDAATKNKYPYLISQSDVDTVSARPGGRESVEWWSLIMGVRKAGVVSNRVLTVEMVEACGGFKDCIWNSPPELKIYGVDAGFGGDACVATYIECGTEVGGKSVMVFGEQKVIPVTVGGTTTAEDQIATFVKGDCAMLGVPDENVFVECGMRATLAVSFARIMSAAINAINFGGPATDRPVSNDVYIFDEKTRQRRLKTCYEHYSKFVSELAFSVRAVVESGQARRFPRIAAEEFQKRETRFVYNDRHEIETKAEYKLRNGGESPNWSDSAMISVEGARRKGFVIENMLSTSATTERDDWLSKEVDKEKKIMRQFQMTYD